MSKPSHYYFPKDKLEHFIFSDEVKKYPHGFECLVKRSDYDKAIQWHRAKMLEELEDITEELERSFSKLKYAKWEGIEDWSLNINRSIARLRSLKEGE